MIDASSESGDMASRGNDPNSGKTDQRAILIAVVVTTALTYLMIALLVVRANPDPKEILIAIAGLSGAIITALLGLLKVSGESAVKIDKIEKSVNGDLDKKFQELRAEIVELKKNQKE